MGIAILLCIMIKRIFSDTFILKSSILPLNICESRVSQAKYRSFEQSPTLKHPQGTPTTEHRSNMAKIQSSYDYQAQCQKDTDGCGAQFPKQNAKYPQNQDLDRYLSGERQQYGPPISLHLSVQHLTLRFIDTKTTSKNLAPAAIRAMATAANATDFCRPPSPIRWRSGKPRHDAGCHGTASERSSSVPIDRRERAASGLLRVAVSALWVVSKAAWKGVTGSPKPRSCRGLGRF